MASDGDATANDRARVVAVDGPRPVGPRRSALRMPIATTSTSVPPSTIEAAAIMARSMIRLIHRQPTRLRRKTADRTHVRRLPSTGRRRVCRWLTTALHTAKPSGTIVKTRALRRACDSVRSALGACGRTFAQHGRGFVERGRDRPAEMGCRRQCLHGQCQVGIVGLRRRPTRRASERLVPSRSSTTSPNGDDGRSRRSRRLVKLAPLRTRRAIASSSGA